MIMFRYRYRFWVSVTDRYCFLVNVTQSDINVPNFPVTCVTSVTDPNIRPFEQIFKVFKKN
jgi:hypothetical protein